MVCDHSKSYKIRASRSLIKKIIIGLSYLSFIISSSAIAKELPRKILGLYNSKADSSAYFSPIHSYAEMPLNHLGFTVTYHDVQQPLPPLSTLKDYYGIFVWFKDNVNELNPKTYCDWLYETTQSGKKLILLESLGLPKKVSLDIPVVCHKVYKSLGVKYEGNNSNNALFIEFHNKNSSMVEFERKLNLIDNHLYFQLIPQRNDVKTELTLRRSDFENSDSSVIFTSNNGGYAGPTFVDYWNPGLQKFQWRINPFEFFRAALDWHHKPAIDTTTIQGHRIFYTHIDGDGSFNISHIDKKTYSAQIILDRIIKRYPRVPITASFVAAYFDLKEYQTPEAQDLYKNIMSAPNVQIASHGYSHPLNWRKQKVAIEVPGHPYSNKNEIVRSVQLHQAKALEFGLKKRVNLFLWTGDCYPNEEQIQLTYDHNFLNMNGGDTRFDSKYNSYGFVKALGLQDGKHLQIYSSNSNENTYTNLWEGPYYGFKSLIETFERTENPIRVKPINIYYHYYSGERLASLEALIQNYNYAVTQDVFALEAHQFPPIVTGFYNNTIHEISPQQYKINPQGTVYTLRFDHDQRHVNMQQSKGVLGYKHEKGSLYVFLNPQEQEVLLTLQTQNSQSPYIEQASFFMTDLKFNATTTRFHKKGWHRSHMILKNLKKNHSYQIKEGIESWTEKTDAKGTLHIQFKIVEGQRGPTAVEITAI